MILFTRRAFHGDRKILLSFCLPGTYLQYFNNIQIEGHKTSSSFRILYLLPYNPNYRNITVIREKVLPPFKSPCFLIYQVKNKFTLLVNSDNFFPIQELKEFVFFL